METAGLRFGDVLAALQAGRRDLEFPARHGPGLRPEDHLPADFRDDSEHRHQKQCQHAENDGPSPNLHVLSSTRQAANSAARVTV